MAMTKYQSNGRTIEASQPIFSTSLAADKMDFVELSDWPFYATSSSLCSRTTLGPSPGRIRFALASLLTCRRYPSKAILESSGSEICPVPCSQRLLELVTGCHTVPF